MTILRFFSQLRFLTMATLLVMVLMRLVWMDLRVYDLKVDPRLADFLTHQGTWDYSCEIRKSSGQEMAIEQSRIENLLTWSSSWLYRSYFQLSCREGVASSASYIRMNQGVLVLIILSCVLICRMYCRSWLIFLAVAAVLLSRGRLLAANGTMSGQMLITLFVSLWLLTLFHWLRTGSKAVAILQWLILFFLLTIEPSIWPVAWASSFCLGLAYLSRGPLLKPLLERIRQTQMKERWYAQLALPASSRSSEGQQQKLFQNVKRVLGLVRPSDWSYQPLAQKFRIGSLLRPLQVPFLLWIYHGRHWQMIFRNSLVAGGLVSLAALLWYSWQQSYGGSPLLLFTTPSRQWWQELWGKIDLDLWVGLLIIGLGLSRGPAAGLISYWESAFLLLVTLVFGAAGIWLWDALSFNSMVDNNSLSELWRSHQYVLWFEPVILTFAALGIYNLLRVFDRLLFQS